MEEEQKRQDAERERRKAQGYEPFRFWTPVGDSRQIIIVDDEPSFFRYEHALKNRRTNRYDNFLPCINEDANCPVCGVTDKPAYFAMYLTVLDLTPYENKDGKEVPWSKKLLVVKPAQQKKIARLFEKHGTLRGMVLEMRRDGDKDASIGNDIEFVEFANEDELLNDFYDEYKDQDGKKIEIDGSVPFDYDKIYPDMTEKQLAAIVGADDNSVGNRDRDDRDSGRRGGRDRGGRDNDDRQDDAPRRSASRRGSRDDDQGDDRQEDRGSSRGSSRRGGRGNDDDQGDDRQEDRGSRRGGRGSRDDDQGDDRQEDRGSRRSATRRGGNDDDQGNDDQGDDRADDRGSSRGGRTSGTRRGREEPQEEAPPRSSRSRRGEASDDAPQRPARGGRGRADADNAEPPFEGDDQGNDDQGGDNSGADRRAALRNRRRG